MYHLIRPNFQCTDVHPPPPTSEGALCINGDPTLWTGPTPAQPWNKGTSATRMFLTSERRDSIPGNTKRPTERALSRCVRCQCNYVKIYPRGRVPPPLLFLPTTDPVTGPGRSEGGGSHGPQLIDDVVRKTLTPQRLHSHLGICHQDPQAVGLPWEASRTLMAQGTLSGSFFHKMPINPINWSER